MPEIVVPDAGAPTLTDWLVRAALAVDESLSLRLFKNDYTPAYTSVLGSFVEATFGGYVQHTLDRGDWAAPVTGLDHVTRIALTVPTRSYTVADPTQTVYGAYLVGLLTLRVYYARRFAVPRVLTVGQVLRVAPVVTLRSEVFP